MPAVRAKTIRQTEAGRNGVKARSPMTEPGGPSAPRLPRGQGCRFRGHGPSRRITFASSSLGTGYDRTDGAQEVIADRGRCGSLLHRGQGSLQIIPPGCIVKPGGTTRARAKCTAHVTNVSRGRSRMECRIARRLNNIRRVLFVGDDKHPGHRRVKNTTIFERSRGCRLQRPRRSGIDQPGIESARRFRGRGVRHEVRVLEGDCVTRADVEGRGHEPHVFDQHGVLVRLRMRRSTVSSEPDEGPEENKAGERRPRCGVSAASLAVVLHVSSALRTPGGL